MKKIAAFVFLALLSASSAQAVTRDECANGGGTFVNSKCFCENGSEWKDGKCSAMCADTTKKPAPKAAAPAPSGPKPPKATKFKAPACSIDLASPVTPASSADPVTFTVTCQPGNGQIQELSGECLTDNCLFDGGAKKVARPQTPVLANGKVVLTPVQEKFTVRAADVKSGIPGTVAFSAKAANGSSDPASAIIKWPLPPPPPAPKRSALQVTCEDVDKPAKWNELNASCECPPPKVNIAWVDKDKVAHLCKDPEPVKVPRDGKDGKDGKTEVIYKGDASHLTLALQGTIMAIDGHPATGLGLTLGGSWSFGAASRWRFNFGGGLMFAPTPEYQANGKQTKDASGNAVKNDTGFLASGGVSFMPLPNLEIGGGVGYWRFGQHWSGANSGKGTIEAFGFEGAVIFYPYKGEAVSFGLALKPMVGVYWGGEKPDTRGTGGASLGALLLF